VNRTDRLYALVEELRAVSPRPRTSAKLAARFEVSVRTIERDLLALQEAGVPIWAQPGPGGGYTLDATRTLPPVNFTPAEAAAVAIALGAPGATPLPQSARTALQKLIAAMAAPAAEAARDLTRRVMAVGQPPSPASTVPPALEQALVERRVVAFDYRDKAGAASARTVEPLGLVGVEDRWYLVGHCRMRDDTRVFRVDRVARPRVLDERAPDRPGGAMPDFEGLVTRPNLLE
jgi:predicted DNA-binding transcriptional regulator YafY